MNQPRVQPDLPPQEGAPADTNPTGNMPNGSPRELADNVPKARPTSDREQTEAATHNIEQGTNPKP